MKTRVLIAATLLVGFAVSAQALTIVGTKHDLSNSARAGSIRSTSTNQVCVFCHTPHNATINKLLWNRTGNPVAANMKIYTSYNTGAMRTALPQSALGNDSNSLLCLSCHALPTANLVVENVVGGAIAASTPAADANWLAKTGKMNDLTNDHPVGINYDSAVTVAGAGTGLTASALGKITGPGGGTTDGVGQLRLFKSGVSGTSTLECASCHNVHDNSYGKFLAATNTASNLCRICHVK